MRIVGGKYKGRIFTPNKKFSARPTTDLAKEALFNILTNSYHFSEMKVLDLFSGTGSIGYEFISRGAEAVTLVEKNPGHVRFIHDVVEKLGITNAQIVRDDVFRFLKYCRQDFDIIFADPPFDAPWLDKIPTTVFEANVLREGGLLILEHPKSYEFTKWPNFAELRQYGKVNFSFFR
ncbi:16S rRNA (guanine(966)-N(2))-methyltransferase RsmD [Mariniphaga sediminis]|uniref:16S rRNA (guanine(966)-N(2))-methyltransferase RsmD n=1 Tax=Mariniphaga sediminis TaxID=1628158 RepID=UPI0035625AEE